MALVALAFGAFDPSDRASLSSRAKRLGMQAMRDTHECWGACLATLGGASKRRHGADASIEVAAPSTTIAPAASRDPEAQAEAEAEEVTGDVAHSAGGGGGGVQRMVSLTPQQRARNWVENEEGEVQEEEGAATLPSAMLAPAFGSAQGGDGVQLAGTLYTRSTGMSKSRRPSCDAMNLFRKVEAVVDGATLRCTNAKGGPSLVLRGSDVERLEVVSSTTLDFALLTRKDGTERGRTYGFRASTCAKHIYYSSCACLCLCVRACVCTIYNGSPRRADFERWVSGLERWLDSLPVVAEASDSVPTRTLSLSPIEQSLPLQRCAMERKPSWERRSSDVRKTEMRRLGSQGEQSTSAAQSTSAPQWAAERRWSGGGSAGGSGAEGPAGPAQDPESPGAAQEPPPAIVRARSANLTL